MPGLAISTSLDCHVKVLNLESYTVLFDINTNKSIINLKSICFSKRSSACVISQKNGAISVLKATSCADYFNTCSLAVQSATRFQRLNSGYKMLVPKNKVISPKKIAPPCPASYQNSSCNFMQKEQEDSDDTDTSESDGDYESDHSVEKPPPVVKEMRRLSRKKSGGDICHPTNRIREEHELAKKLAKEKEKEREKNRDSSSDYSSCVVASSAQDLCVFLESGQLRSRIDSRLVIDGVKCYTISVAQELLFVYFESGRLSVFCVRTLEGRLLKSLPAGNAELKNVVCMVLVDTILRETERMDFDDARKNSSGTKDPRNYPKSDATFNEYKRRASRTANRRSSEQQSLQKKYDLRNNLLSSYENIGCQEMVLLGTVTGMLYGMNTTTDKLNDCNTWDLGVSFQYRVEKQESTTIERMTFRSYGSDLRRPSLNGDTGVGGMNYGRRKSFMNRRCHGKDLFIVSNEKSTTALGRRTLRVYSLPSLECTYVLKNILTFTSFEVSLSLPYLAMGYDDGNVKLFELMRKGGTGADTVENDFNDMISRRNSLLMTGGDPGSRASNELTRRSSCDYIAEGVIREITQSGMSHTDKVTSISFNDKLKLYVTSSLDCTVRVWNFKKQEITILNFKSPSICVLFYGFDSGNVASPNATIVKGNEFEKARDSILILQRNYLLSVRKNIWDPENKVAVEYNPKTPPVVEGVEGDMVARNGGGFSPGDVEYLEQILRLSNPNGSVSFSGVGSSGPVSTPRAVSCPALTPPATVITSPMIVRPPLSYSPVPLAVSFADSTPYVPSNSSTANKIQRAKDFTDTFAENSFNSPTTSEVPVAAGLNGIAEIQITPHVRASRRNSSPFPIANNNTFPFPAPLDIETNFVSPSRLPRGYMNSCMTSIGNTSTDSHDSFGYNSSYTLSNTSNNSGYPSDDEGPKEREREKDREKDGIMSGIMSGINSGTSSSKIRSRSGSFNLNVRVPLNGKPTRISGIMGMGGVRKERDRRTPGDEGGIVALKMGLDLREVTNNSMNLAICSFSTNLLTAHTSSYNSSNSSRIGTHSNNTPRAGTGTLNSARYSM